MTTRLLTASLALAIATACLAQTTTRPKPAWAKPPVPTAPAPSSPASPTEPANPAGRPGDPSPNATGKVDLRPRFKLGQEVRLSMDIANSRQQTGVAATDAGNAKQDIHCTLKLKCTSVDESGYTLDLVIESFKFDGDMGGQTVHFDSKKPAGDDPMGEVMNALIGTALPVKMDLSGNITSLGGGLSGLSALGGGSGSAADALKGMFGPLATSRKGSGFSNVGDSWSNEDVMDTGLGHVRLKTTNTLKSASRGNATITTKGTFSLDPSSTGPGISIRESSLDGETHWDTDSGMLDSMTMKQKLRVEQKPQSGSTPSSSTNEVDMKVERLSK